ncbi:hypothetical protein HBH39_10005 [Shewanella aestuarii]|uniref:Uncharacterized protein n=1 Tax=Shewanella aestuarii TaxID=1028752 RepID=A0A6G9QL44_9GAMM|nr:hypothetical protein [Shewanella aestuarii]QIR14777.1 hypothetical protein HBH39_10005 [Shewanella aestuarii]
MIRFNYHLNQDNFELQASNWSGLEKVVVNGQVVSKKFNFGVLSKHDVLLKNGAKYSFQLLVDPKTELLTCRIYKQHRLLTVLKQSKQQLQKSQRVLEVGLVVMMCSLLSIYLVV